MTFWTLKELRRPQIVSIPLSSSSALRSRMQPEAFRHWFLIVMIFLGLYLAGSAIYNISAS